MGVMDRETYSKVREAMNAMATIVDMWLSKGSRLEETALATLEAIDYLEGLVEEALGVEESDEADRADGAGDEEAWLH